MVGNWEMFGGQRQRERVSGEGLRVCEDVCEGVSEGGV